ncbi:MAG: rhomboid family intramembrane serine protease [Pseudarcicella sp.]|nr:rhomboid family intramembrane serine protease [Pseudarcicella sp.]
MNWFTDDFKQAFNKSNNSLMQLIWINIVVYLTTLVLQLSLMALSQTWVLEHILSYFSLSAVLPNVLYKPWTLLTYSFFHAINPIAHLLPNMLMLYWFGGIIQEYIGSKRLIHLFIYGAIFGGIFVIGLENLLPFFQHSLSSNIIGASGAVMAIVFGATTLVPEYTFYLFLIGPIKIKYIAVFLLILSLVSALNMQNVGGELVHVGGAMMGYFYVKFLKNGTDLGVPIEYISMFFKNLFQKKPEKSIKVTYRNPNNTVSQASNQYNNASFPDDDEIDEILDKISKSGYESLTKTEKQLLFKASQKK